MQTKGTMRCPQQINVAQRLPLSHVERTMIGIVSILTLPKLHLATLKKKNPYQFFLPMFEVYESVKFHLTVYLLAHFSWPLGGTMLLIWKADHQL